MGQRPTDKFLYEGMRSYFDAMGAVKAFQREVVSTSRQVLEQSLGKLSAALGIRSKASDIVHGIWPDEYDGEEVTEEDRYAQFIDLDGIKAPFIIDRYTNGKQNSRINYESIEFNKSIPDSVFSKPSNPKDLKKDLKL